MRDDAAQEARPAAAARPRPGLARNVASVLATDAASSLAVLCSGIVLARWLSVADRGVYAVLIALQATLVTVFQLGLPSAAIHRIRAAGAPPARVATAGIATVVALSLLVLTLPMLLAPWLREGLLPTAPAGVLLLAVAAVPAQLATAWLGGLARALDRFDLANAARLSVNAGTLLMATVVLVGGGGGLRGLLWALLLLHAGVALALGKRVLRRTGVSRRPDLDEIRAGLGFGALNHGETLSATLHERADVFLLTFLLADPSPVALYAVAVGAVQRLRMLPAAASLALFPRISGLAPGEAHALTATLLRHALLWVTVSLALLLPLAPWLIPLLFGAAYHGSVVPFQILLPAMAAVAVSAVLGSFLTAFGRQRTNIAAQGLSGLLNVGLNLWWIPAFGIVGAAWASLVSYGLGAAVVALVFLRAVPGLGARDLLLVRRGDLARYLEEGHALVRRLRAARA